MPSNQWSTATSTGPSLEKDPLIPSYLRGSRLAGRLQAAHRAKHAASAAATRDNPRSGQSSGAGSLSTSSSSVNLHKPSPASHRGMTHDIIERAAPAAVYEDQPSPLPSRWSDTDKASGLELSDNGLEVRCIGLSKTSHEEAAAVRADHPMPRECGIYYFEVEVVSKNKEGLISIGFSGPKVTLSRLPGWEPDSWAYHGDDGNIFACQSSGKSYGPKYAMLDVIGCGVNFRTGSVFFTNNGNLLGNAVTLPSSKTATLYPSVGLKKSNEKLRVNFGHTPFIFDIDTLVQKERRIVMNEVNAANVSTLTSPPLSENQLIHKLIAQYLAHDGYIETARAFAEEVRQETQALTHGTGVALGMQDLEPGEDVDAIRRQKIRSAVLEGDIDQALGYMQKWYDGVFAHNENIYFKLRCRKFIEMIRRLTELQDAAAGVGPEPRPQRSGHSSTGVSSSASPAFSAKKNAAAHRGVPGTGDRPLSAATDEFDVFDHQMELDEQLGAPPGALQGNGGGAPVEGDWETVMDTSDDVGQGAGGVRRSHSNGYGHGRPVHKDSYSRLLAETLDYGKELKMEFSSDPRREVKKALEDTLALIAYDNPRESPLRELLEERGRVPVAEELNGVILVSLGRPCTSALERLVAQTEVLLGELSGDGGAGAFVNLFDEDEEKKAKEEGVGS
ncbi:SPRY-domain-containing protein [Trichodelitschia bisporula]|uniref:SPRY-domain-containing protein n=1 Tax=Trichodelitschia bisporula TaxID=703511 RepID=A0A6G1I0K1_9PEZI|nr:SPRY-domain-containing protein [Trichodelitschia bisporula]